MKEWLMNKGIFKAAGWFFVLLALLVGIWNLRPTSQALEATTLALKPVTNHTTTNPSAPYCFIAFGDWGAGTSFQKDVAGQVNSLYARHPFDAVLMLGDNIYEYGDINKYGKAYFTDMYAPLIHGGVNFIVALGNHDVRAGHGEEQMRFFHMPGYYYLVHKPHVDFFVINSNTFNTDAVQQKWLDKQLAASTADWKIVMGHHPIYSSGEHGFNKELHETLEPILDKHHADLYLAGHDHDYERFQPIQGVQYIVAGGGGAYLRGFDKPMPKSLVRIKAHHFLSFQAAADDLKMQVIDKTGKQIDQAEWTKALSKPQKSRFLGSR
jgi:hypothetical protein